MKNKIDTVLKKLEINLFKKYNLFLRFFISIICLSQIIILITTVLGWNHSLIVVENGGRTWFSIIIYLTVVIEFYLTVFLLWSIKLISIKDKNKAIYILQIILIFILGVIIALLAASFYIGLIVKGL